MHTGRPLAPAMTMTPMASSKHSSAAASSSPVRTPAVCSVSSPSYPPDAELTLSIGHTPHHTVPMRLTAIRLMPVTQRLKLIHRGKITLTATARYSTAHRYLRHTRHLHYLMTAAITRARCQTQHVPTPLAVNRPRQTSMSHRLSSYFPVDKSVPPSNWSHSTRTLLYPLECRTKQKFQSRFG